MTAYIIFILSLLAGFAGLAGSLYFHHKTGKRRHRVFLLLFAVFDAAMAAFLLWASDYYHAGEAAAAAMLPDSLVSVEKTDTGWLFDGPSDEKALIFYPGAKVDEKAYAPLLHALAEKEMDVYLVKMPLHLAFFGMNAARSICREGRYDRYYIGGHSLGGAMAAFYAAGHEEEIDGEILFAAYPTKKTAVDTLLIYGSEDGVLNMSRAEEAEALVSGVYEAYCIAGGNHAQFGDYGEQSGDGKARITAGEQQRITIEKIGTFLKNISTRP